ncbi:MAG: YceI family protein [Myxococcota bacterium]
MQQQTVARPQATWQIDGKKSVVYFRGTNSLAAAAIVGMFSNIKGDVVYDQAAAQNSRVRLIIPVKTLNIKKEMMKNVKNENEKAHARFENASNEKLIEKILSEGFFGFYKGKGDKKTINPEGKFIQFISTSVSILESKPQKMTLNICGNLKIRGKLKKNQCFQGALADVPSSSRPTKRFVGEAVVNRQDFGVGTGFMKWTIHNDVNIKMDILLYQDPTATQQQPAQPQTQPQPSSQQVR